MGMRYADRHRHSVSRGGRRGDRRRAEIRSRDERRRTHSRRRSRSRDRSRARDRSRGRRESRCGRDDRRKRDYDESSERSPSAASSSSADSDSPKTNYEGRFVRSGRCSYEVTRRLGAGSFGECYAGEDQHGRQVCLKVAREAERSEDRLEQEYQFLCMLEEGVERHQRVTPAAYDLVKLGGDEILIQELMGDSLEDLFQGHGKFLSQETVLAIAPQIIDCIRHVHDCGILHRDIKPNNFLVGRGEKAGSVYIIDFGLSKMWAKKSGEHVPLRLGRGLTGTARFVSLNVHRGYEQSRRDDLLSIGYMLIYLCQGSLPWQGLIDPKTGKRNTDDHIHLVKESTALSALCRGLRPEFQEYMRYCSGLGFAEPPDYSYLKDLMRDALRGLGHTEHTVRLDWMPQRDSDPGEWSGEEHGGADSISSIPSAEMCPQDHFDPQGGFPPPS